MQNFTALMDALRKSIYKGNFSEGAGTLSRWLLEDISKDEYVEIQLELILLALVCSDLDDAEQRWQDVSDDLSPNENLKHLAYWAFFQFYNNHRQTALKMFEHCLTEEPNQFEFYLLRGMGYSLCGQHEHAQADFERANALSPMNVLILSLLGDVCAELGETERAISLHETVLDACPDFRRSLTSLGVLFCDNGRLDDSFRLFQCLVGYDPANWFAWTCLGDIVGSHSGHTFEALMYYSASVVTGCEIGQTYLNCIKGLLSLGRYRQARLLFDRFEKKLKWEETDRFAALYLKLVCDVALHPGLIGEPEFEKRFRRLAPYNDTSSHLLFEVLAALSSLDYNDDIVHIFAIHMICFIRMAKYMNLCHTRLIFPEETILIAMLTHLNIWSGLGFEARALLALLSGADDPRVIDMMYLLWGELHERDEIAWQSGTHFEHFHESVIKDGNSELEFEKYSTGKLEKITGYVNWRSALSKSDEMPSGSDFVKALFNFPFESVITELEKEIGNDNPMRAEIHSEFWNAYQAWQQMTRDGQNLKDFWNSQTQVETGRVLSLLKKLTKIEGSKPTVEIPFREKVQNSAWNRILKSVCHRQREIISEVDTSGDNDNRESAVMTQSEDALHGFEPLPFSFDGTAFKRQFPLFKDEYHLLETASLDDLLSLLVRKCLQAEKRSQTNGKISPAGDEELQEKVKEINQLCNILHGLSPIDRQVVERAGKHHIDELFKRLSGHLPSCASLMRWENGLPDEGLTLPQSPLVSVPISYKIPSLPEFPGCVSVYRQPIPANFLTRRDLCEQFFNYAVYCVDAWFETGDDSHLKVFFNDDLVHFKKFVRRHKVKTSGSMHIEIASAVSHDKLFVRREAALNSDVERKRKRVRSKMTGRAPATLDPTRIYFVHEMAESLRQAKQWAKTAHIPLLCTDYNTGFRKNPFLEQFYQWAERHADALWMDMARLEDQLRLFEAADQYTMIWQIHDILNRYPFLSRVYVLLAGIYARMGDEEKALQAVQSGIQWEDKLYQYVGWYPIHPAKEQPECETAFEPVTAETELGEPQYVLWPERFVFLPKDEGMYHYTSLDYIPGMRCRVPSMISPFLNRVSWNDKGGCYDFYRLMRKFISMTPQLRDVYVGAIATSGVHSLRDYMAYVVTNMVSPETFPLRRQLAELMFKLFPNENTSAMGRYFCDNLQLANAVPYASYALLMNLGIPPEKDVCQTYATMGSLIYDLGFIDEAIDYLEHTLKAEPQSPMALLTLGCAFIEKHECEKAIEYLKRGYRLDPAVDRFFYNMALAYLELGRTDEAEKIVERGMAMTKYPFDFKLQLLRIYVHDGRFVEALPIVRELSVEDPEFISNTLSLAEFEKFRQLAAVKKIMDECSYGKK